MTTELRNEILKAINDASNNTMEALRMLGTECALNKGKVFSETREQWGLVRNHAYGLELLAAELVRKIDAAR